MNPIFIRKEAIMATKGSWKKKKIDPNMENYDGQLLYGKKMQRLSKIFTPDLRNILSI
jgi:hypothetical protein